MNRFKLALDKLALAWVMVGFSCFANAQSFGGVAHMTSESDSEHFAATRLRAGGLFGYQSPWQYFGVAAQENFYSQSGWHRHATSVLGLWRDQTRDTLAGIDAELGIVEVAGHTRPVGNATWTLRPSTDTGIDLLAAAGLVETQTAIERGIGYTYLGASAEQKLAEPLTIIALAAYQPVTDGNERSHLRARLIWDALPEQGINLQARWRGYRNSKIDVGGAYFNPQTYQNWQGVVGFRKRLSGWTTSGSFGAGRETIRNGDTTEQPTYLAELRAEGPVAEAARVAVQASYNRSAGISNGPGYWWGYLSFTLIVPF